MTNIYMYIGVCVCDLLYSDQKEWMGMMMVFQSTTSKELEKQNPVYKHRAHYL